MSPSHEFLTGYVGRVLVIVLVQKRTGRCKWFSLWGGQRESNLRRHMASLTEAQCEAFFEIKGRRKRTTVSPHIEDVALTELGKQLLKEKSP